MDCALHKATSTHFTYKTEVCHTIASLYAFIHAFEVILEMKYLYNLKCVQGLLLK